MRRDLAGQRVVVMGLGRFGGGVGAARWLAGQGADVLLTDLAPAERLAESLVHIQDLIDAGAVRLRLGGHDERDFRNADLVVVSPAVPKPWENRFILTAVEAGARLTTEIRLLVEHLPNRGRTIGVTGTAGKSTTAAMIAHILRSIIADGRDARPTESSIIDGRVARPTGDISSTVDACFLQGARVWLGGNIGGSLLPRVAEIAPDDWVVLELSSAMLYWLGDGFVGRREEAGWSPSIALLTNVSPNHLDWHGSFEHYQACKKNIVRFQRPGERDLVGLFLRGCSCVHDKAVTDSGTAVSAVVGGDSTGETPVPLETPIPLKQKESDASPDPNHATLLDELRVVGQHNRLNAAFAVDAAQAALASIGLDATQDALLGAVQSFPGLPHRLQIVACAPRDGGVIRACNDSKATTPEATALAIEAFADDPAVGADRIHLICGGYDKGLDLAPMVGPAAGCSSVLTIGAMGPELAAAIAKKDGRATECGRLDRAVEQAAEMARAGEVILLSPGCASWDQFSSYEERGRRFTELVRRRFGLEPAAEAIFQMPSEVGPE